VYSSVYSWTTRFDDHAAEESKPFSAARAGRQPASLSLTWMDMREAAKVEVNRLDLRMRWIKYSEE